MYNMDLTKRQQEVLKAIEDYSENHKYAPTIRELCTIIGVKSTSTAYNLLKQLKNKGYIKNVEGCPRTIYIFKDLTNQ
jgi:repressor LexA